MLINAVTIVIRATDIEKGRDFLLQQGLIEHATGKSYDLTYRGSLLADIANREHYVNTCKERIESDYSERKTKTKEMEFYWKIVNKPIDYNAIVMLIFIQGENLNKCDSILSPKFDNVFVFLLLM